MFNQLVHWDEPIIGALKLDAACVVCNLLLMPGEPDLHRQTVLNAARLRAVCEQYGMPLMIEPLVLKANEAKGGYQVDGDKKLIIPLVRQARELGADVIKADPTDHAEDYHEVVQAARCPILVRGGGKKPIETVFAGGGRFPRARRARSRLRPQHLSTPESRTNRGGLHGDDSRRRRRVPRDGHLRRPTVTRAICPYPMSITATPPPKTSQVTRGEKDRLLHRRRSSAVRQHRAAIPRESDLQSGAGHEPCIHRDRTRDCPVVGRGLGPAGRLSCRTTFARGGDAVARSWWRARC